MKKFVLLTLLILYSFINVAHTVKTAKNHKIKAKIDEDQIPTWLQKLLVVGVVVYAASKISLVDVLRYSVTNNRNVESRRGAQKPPELAPNLANIYKYFATIYARMPLSDNFYERTVSSAVKSNLNFFMPRQLINKFIRIFQVIIRLTNIQSNKDIPLIRKLPDPNGKVIDYNEENDFGLAQTARINHEHYYCINTAAILEKYTEVVKQVTSKQIKTLEQRHLDQVGEICKDNLNLCGLFLGVEGSDLLIDDIVIITEDLIENYKKLGFSQIGKVENYFFLICRGCKKENFIRNLILVPKSYIRNGEVLLTANEQIMSHDKFTEFTGLEFEYDTFFKYIEPEFYKTIIKTRLVKVIQISKHFLFIDLAPKTFASSSKNTQRLFLNSFKINNGSKGSSIVNKYGFLYNSNSQVHGCEVFDEFKSTLNNKIYNYRYPTVLPPIGVQFFQTYVYQIFTSPKYWDKMEGYVSTLADNYKNPASIKELTSNINKYGLDLYNQEFFNDYAIFCQELLSNFNVSTLNKNNLKVELSSFYQSFKEKYLKFLHNYIMNIIRDSQEYFQNKFIKNTSATQKYLNLFGDLFEQKYLDLQYITTRFFDQLYVKKADYKTYKVQNTDTYKLALNKAFEQSYNGVFNEKHLETDKSDTKFRLKNIILGLTHDDIIDFREAYNEENKPALITTENVQMNKNFLEFVFKWLINKAGGYVYWDDGQNLKGYLIELLKSRIFFTDPRSLFKSYFCSVNAKSTLIDQATLNQETRDIKNFEDSFDEYFVSGYVRDKNFDLSEGLCDHLNKCYDKDNSYSTKQPSNSNTLTKSAPSLNDPQVLGGVANKDYVSKRSIIYFKPDLSNLNINFIPTFERHSRYFKKDGEKFYNLLTNLKVNAESKSYFASKDIVDKTTTVRGITIPANSIHNILYIDYGYKGMATKNNFSMKEYIPLNALDTKINKEGDERILMRLHMKVRDPNFLAKSDNSVNRQCLLNFYINNENDKLKQFGASLDKLFPLDYKYITYRGFWSFNLFKLVNPLTADGTDYSFKLAELLPTQPTEGCSDYQIFIPFKFSIPLKKNEVRFVKIKDGAITEKVQSGQFTMADVYWVGITSGRYFNKFYDSKYHDGYYLMDKAEIKKNGENYVVAVFLKNFRPASDDFILKREELCKGK